VDKREWPKVILRRSSRGAADAIRSYSILPEGRPVPTEPDGREAEVYVPESRAIDAETALSFERERVEKLERDLAECYRLTGSDPDGDSDRHLARHAVRAVRELREENGRIGEWEDRAFEAERALQELGGHRG